MPQQQLSSDATVQSILVPASVTSSSTPKIGYMSMKGISNAEFILNIGALGSGESLTAVLNQATSSNGTGAKVFSPTKAITAITSLTPNVTVVVNLAGDEMDANNGFTHAALLVTLTSSNASLISGVALVNSNGKPITPLTTVVQTI